MANPQRTTPLNRDPQYMSRIGKIGSLRQQALHSTVETTAASRAVIAQKLRDRLIQEIDPEGKLPPAELERRVEAGRRAHFARIALKSSAVRTAKRQARMQGGAS